MKCPHCGSEMFEETPSNSWSHDKGLPGNDIIRQFRCQKRSDNTCGKPVVLVAGIWYKWIWDSRQDCYWEPFDEFKEKPRKISSNFIGGKRVFQT